MNKTDHRSPFAIVGRLIVLVKPMLPVMLAAIVMGVAGHFCATFITIFGGFGILRALGLASPVGTVSTAFACILVFALLRGVLRYAEQASNHYIAFKLQNDIMRAIHSLAGKKTIILISHRLANVVHSDCIYAMDKGRVIEQGTHAELLAKQGAYSRLYLAQRQLETLEEEDA